jgi:hypothetical protein
LTIQIFDCPSLNQYEEIVRENILNSQIIFLTFDLTEISTFQNLEFWKNLIEENVFKKFENQFFKVNMILVGGKCDLIEKRKIDSAFGIQSSQELFQFPIEYIETSSKNEFNVRKCFHLSIKQFWKNQTIQRYKSKVNEEMICKYGNLPNKELELSNYFDFLIFGESFSGKTDFVNHICNLKLSSNYSPSKYVIKRQHKGLLDNRHVNVSYYEVPFHLKFNKVVLEDLKYCDGAFLLISINEESPQNSLAQWTKYFEQYYLFCFNS